ncbi:MAG: hypothetical protein RLZZ519_925 [Bacteroidota bacterium]
MRFRSERGKSLIWNSEPLIMKALNKMILFLQSYTLHVPVWIRLLLVLGAFVMPTYWAVTGTGMYAALAEWQSGPTGGSHYIVISFGLPLIFFLLPALAILLVIGQFFPEIDPKTKKKSIF